MEIRLIPPTILILKEVWRIAHRLALRLPTHLSEPVVITNLGFHHNYGYFTRHSTSPVFHEVLSAILPVIPTVQ